MDLQFYEVPKKCEWHCYEDMPKDNRFKSYSDFWALAPKKFEFEDSEEGLNRLKVTLTDGSSIDAGTKGMFFGR